MSGSPFGFEPKSLKVCLPLHHKDAPQHNGPCAQELSKGKSSHTVKLSIKENFIIFIILTSSLCIQDCYPSKSSFNPFPQMTILQQTTLNIFCHKMENLSNWVDNPWLKVENIVAIGEIARAISSFITMFSKSRLLQRRQKASIWGKGLNIYAHCTIKSLKRLKVSLSFKNH